MKKSFKLAAIALTAMAMMTACNNNAAEEVVDSTLIEGPVAEEVIDTPIQEPVVEEAQPVQTQTKKAPAKKKEEPKVEEKKGLTIEVGNSQVEVNEESVKVKPLKKK